MQFPTDKETVCKTLNGTQSYFYRCVGFCTFHKVYVTAKQAKTKQCAAKHCKAIIKTDHPYWKERELKKLMRKLKKNGENIDLSEAKELVGLIQLNINEENKNNIEQSEQIENKNIFKDDFAVKCAEIYSLYLNKNLSEVYESFFATGLHTWLSDGKERFETMDDEELITYCDDWIQNYRRTSH